MIFLLYFTHHCLRLKRLHHRHTFWINLFFYLRPYTTNSIIGTVSLQLMSMILIYLRVFSIMIKIDYHEYRTVYGNASIVCLNDFSSSYSLHRIWILLYFSSALFFSFTSIFFLFFDFVSFVLFFLTNFLGFVDAHLILLVYYTKTHIYGGVEIVYIVFTNFILTVKTPWNERIHSIHESLLCCFCRIVMED